MSEKPLTLTQMKNMSDEELRPLSLMKNKKGCATSEAKLAQKVLWERAGSPYSIEGYNDMWVNFGGMARKRKG